MGGKSAGRLTYGDGEGFGISASCNFDIGTGECDKVVRSRVLAEAR
jgi:hypothetical protein